MRLRVRNCVNGGCVGSVEIPTAVPGRVVAMCRGDDRADAIRKAALLAERIATDPVMGALMPEDTLGALERAREIADAYDGHAVGIAPIVLFAAQVAKKYGPGVAKKAVKAYKARRAKKAKAAQRRVAKRQESPAEEPQESPAEEPQESEMEEGDE